MNDPETAISSAAVPNARAFSRFQASGEVLALRYQQYKPAVPAQVDLTYALAKSMTTGELARRLLGPDAVPEIADHHLSEPIFRGGHLRGIEFFSPPRPVEKEICARIRFYVDLEPLGRSTVDKTPKDLPVVKQGVSAETQIVLAAGCRLQQKSFFGYVKDAPFDEGRTRCGVCWPSNTRQGAGVDLSRNWSV